MIICTIDGRRAVPAASNNIKVTLENPFVKDSGEYTYDIKFPMDIAENRDVFGNVQRFEVKKTGQTFQACRLYADGVMVVEGKGVVTSVTNKEVKLQIVGGKSRLKYDDRFDKVFIDEVMYDYVEINQGLDKSEGHFPSGKYTFEHNSYNTGIGWNSPMLPVDFTTAAFVGKKGVAAFCPIWDEPNGKWANETYADDDFSIRYPEGRKSYKGGVWMKRLAVQPNLIYVLHRALRAVGFRVERNDYDCEPWNRLYFASARPTVDIKRALPHWTVYQLMEEFRKLLGATFVFSEQLKTVSIINQNELETASVVTYDCLDDFSVEYEEDGLSSTLTSNLEYDLGTSADRAWPEVVTKEVWDKFPIEEVTKGTVHEKLTKADLQKIYYSVPRDYYYVLSADENGVEEVTMVGYFGQLVRDAESDEMLTLKLAPAAMTERNPPEVSYGTRKDPLRCFAPSVDSGEAEDSEHMTVDETGEYFQSARDAIEAGEVEKEEKQEDSEMEPAMLMFVSGRFIHNVKSHRTMLFTETTDDKEYRYPVTFTECCQNAQYVSQLEYASLALQNHGLTNRAADPGRRVGIGARRTPIADKHNAMTIQFLCDSVPDPKNIYAFRGKRFVCAKIEMTVGSEGLDKMKTGYFYELSE